MLYAYLTNEELWHRLMSDPTHKGLQAEVVRRYLQRGFVNKASDIRG